MAFLESIIFAGGHKINLEFKTTFFQKLRGLIGKKYLKKDEAIVLVDCKQIHTFGMKFSIDVIVLDKKDKIVAVIDNLRPNRISPFYRKAKNIIELTTNLDNNKLFKVGKVIKLTN